MTDKWQPGKTYPPGSLVIPASQPAVDATSAENGDFAAGNSGWDYTGSCTFSSTGGYSNANCCIAPGVTAGGLALNKAKFLMSPGETISANCMIQQGASDVDHTRGYVQVLFFDASDAQIGQPVSGNIVNDGRGGAWHPSSVQATAPAGTSYARCGIYLYQNSADPIWGDNLVVTYARRKPPAGLIFKATQASPGKSAQTEPVWPTSTGVTVTDNEVTWEGVIATRLVWEASPILKSGATEPTWATSVGGAVHDGTIDWLAASRRVEDANCPNTKIVAIAAGKVYAADNDIIRYCATVNPLDWSATDDAGYLPFGLQTYGSNPIAAMGLYRSNLVAFNSEGFQMWQVDPDPASITLLDALPVASTHNKALAPVANDLLFLSSLGVRSIGIAASSVNLQAGDVGMPIDVLVRESIRIATANGTPVLATYYPGAGQYWLAVRALQPLSLSGHLPDGPVGKAVSYQYAVSGGVLPRVVSILSGALPAGLSMSATGLVTGTRTTLGAYAWTVRVVDADGTTADLADASTTHKIRAAYFDGVGDYLSAPFTPPILATGDFTVQFRVSPSVAKSHGIVSGRNSSIRGWAAQVNIDSTAGWRQSMNGGLIDSGSNVPGAGSVPINALTHVAITRKGNLFTVWVNGSAVSSTTQSGSIDEPAVTSLIIGSSYAATLENILKGYLDWLTINIGTCLYDAAFTPPTDPEQVPSPQVRLPFDEAIGETTFTDTGSLGLTWATLGDVVIVEYPY